MNEKVAVKRGRPSKTYVNDVMYEIVKRVSQGETLTAICKEKGMPCTSTFRKWIMENPELNKLWLIAKELRAHALFDEAIDQARILERGEGKEATANQTRALQTAISTLQWAAGRLNPREYGERVPTNPIVPIQIVTNLNLGQEGPAVKYGGDDVFEIKLVQPVPVEALPDARDNSRD